PEAGSACGDVTIEQIGEDVITGNACEGYTYTRTWRATSERGLWVNTSQTITVRPDTKAPVFSRLPGNLVLPCGSELPNFAISVSDNADHEVSITTNIERSGEGCDEVIT